jgi:hypothetical protein
MADLFTAEAQRHEDGGDEDERGTDYQLTTDGSTAVA